MKWKKMSSGISSRRKESTCFSFASSKTKKDFPKAQGLGSARTDNTFRELSNSMAASTWIGLSELNLLTNVKTDSSSKSWLFSPPRFLPHCLPSISRSLLAFLINPPSPLSSYYYFLSILSTPPPLNRFFVTPIYRSPSVSSVRCYWP